MSSRTGASLRSRQNPSGSPGSSSTPPRARGTLQLRLTHGVSAVWPSPSLERTRYGKRCKPGLRHVVHHLSPGLQRLPPLVAQLERFYDAALAPLGYIRVWTDLRPGEQEQAVGYGPPGSDDMLAVKQVEQRIPSFPGFHVAFSASSRAAVSAFHAAALAAGGTDNGPPGLRPDYGPNYFAAFVVDPEGHRIEAVCKAIE
jgi:catechol 2,3-dioxygenase-like lactoylglutathione lyase family enzyme